MSEKFLLLAEDNPNDVFLTERALKKCGYMNRMVIVSNGQEAIDYLFALDPGDQPAVILLDLKLPFIDGLEVLRQIRSTERIRLLPVIVLSASVDEKDRQECLRLGANDFQCKPIRFDEFVLFINQICHIWLSE